MTDPTPADRIRALTLIEAANHLRDAHFQHGMSVQEIGTALRNTADEADPMVGSLARDGFGLDEIAAMLAQPATTPPSVPSDEPQFGIDGCTCIPWTRHTDPPRYLDLATDTVDMISGWERTLNCPHHTRRIDPERLARWQHAVESVTGTGSEQYAEPFMALADEEQAGLRTENVRMRHELEVMYGRAFDAAPSVPADADLRTRLAQALDAAFESFDPERTEDAELSGHLADAVLAVLPEAPRPFDARVGLQRLTDSPAPGESYRHYKGGLYTILAVAEDTGTGAPVVVYHDEQQHHWTRPLAEFAGTVTDGARRFTLEGEPATLPAPADRATLKPMFEGLARLLATSSRDWGTYRVDAWLYAVLVGWDCEQTEHDETCVHGAMEETAQRHGWDADTVAKARRYRAAVRRMADETQQPTGRCTCPHAADEHSIYGCADGCACEWMPKRTPMDPVHILGVDSEDPEGSAALRARLLSRPTPAVRADVAQQAEPECSASISGICLALVESDGPCDTGAGECVHGGKPADDQADRVLDERVAAAKERPVGLPPQLQAALDVMAKRGRVVELTAGRENSGVVAYRNSDRPGVLLCREHGDGWMGLTPLTSDDLPDGGLCDACGVDVLIPQQQAGEA